MRRRAAPTVGELVARAHAADARLRADPLHRRLLAGEVDREEYAAWLVQLHKFVAHLARAQPGPSSEAAEDVARLEADLAALWGAPLDEVRRRIEGEPAAPSVSAWGALTRVMLHRHPAGLVGVALALERLALLQAGPIRAALAAGGALAGVDGAVSFLAARAARARRPARVAALAALRDPLERGTALFYADAAVSLLEGIASHLSGRATVALAGGPS